MVTLPVKLDPETVTVDFGGPLLGVMKMLGGMGVGVGTGVEVGHGVPLPMGQSAQTEGGRSARSPTTSRKKTVVVKIQRTRCGPTQPGTALN